MVIDRGTDQANVFGEKSGITGAIPRAMADYRVAGE